MVFDGKSLAERKEIKIRERVALLLEKSICPKIVSVVLDGSKDTALYVRLKKQTAQRVGIEFEEGRIDDLHEVGNREDVHGVWVQLPLPAEMDVLQVLSAIPLEKDIDCLNPLNLGRLFFPGTALMPATARAVVTILETSKVEIVGKRVVVIGSSPWLGKPLSLVLSNLGATVTMVWETERDLAELTRQADVLVSAVGQAGLIRADMVKEGAVVIDIGISHVDGKVAGDVDFENVKNVAGIITPVPGGVGPLTVVSLLENCLDLIDQSR